jgi:hypothetical protein
MGAGGDISGSASAGRCVMAVNLSLESVAQRVRRGWGDIRQAEGQRCRTALSLHAHSCVKYVTCHSTDPERGGCGSTLGQEFEPSAQPRTAVAHNPAAELCSWALTGCKIYTNSQTGAPSSFGAQETGIR